MMKKIKRTYHNKNKKTWQLMSEGPRISHFFMSLIWSEVFKGGYHAKFTRGYQTPDFIWFSDEKLHAEYRTKEWMEYAKKIGLKNFLDDNFYTDYIKEIDKYILKAKIIENKIDYNHKYSKKSLMKLSTDIIEVYKQLIGSIFSNWPEYTNGLSEKLNKELKNKIKSKVDRQKAFITLTHPESISEFTYEEIDFLNMIIKIRNIINFFSRDILTKYPKIRDLLRSHYDRYWLMSASDRTKPWSKKELYLRVLDYIESNKNPEIKRKVIIKKYGSILDKKRELASIYNLSRQTITLASRISTIGFYRFKASFAWRKFGYFFVKVFNQLAKKEKISFQKMSSITVEEFFKYLKGQKLNKIISKQDLAKRSEAELYYVKNHKPFFYFGKEAVKKKNQLLKNAKYNLKRIQGEIGNTGCVTGKAFVFSWNDSVEEKIHNMPDDAILVVPQTHPAYMPIIRKAKAIVSDEGGVTGHAAIVSRELGKPCIIGTHIGTKVIKDNDLIKVDANNGIVTKIINNPSS